MDLKERILSSLAKMRESDITVKEEVLFVLSLTSFKIILGEKYVPLFSTLFQNLSFPTTTLSLSRLLRWKGSSERGQLPSGPNTTDFLPSFKKNSRVDTVIELKTLLEALDARDALKLLLEEDLLGTILEVHVINNRKSNGMFFTPPEVVEKILSETLELKGRSILNRLKKNVTDAISEKKEENMVQHFHEAFTQLQELIVVDPACGSGNFLIMCFKKLKIFYQEMVGLLNEITREESIRGSKFSELTSNINTPSKLLVGYMLPQLRGIDKDARAVFLTRLKLFLLVFTSIPPREQTRDLALSIMHLLQWTIQQGDSLVHVPVEKQLNMLQNRRIKERMSILASWWREKEQWLTNSVMTRKFLTECQKLKNDVKKTRTSYKNGNVAMTPRQNPFNWVLTWWDAFIRMDNNKKPVLKENKGFSIIIGNPPYFSIRGKGRGNLKRTWYHEYFKNDPFWRRWFRSQSDIYYYFMIDALQHLQDEGMVGFIVEDYWVENDHADLLKRYLLAHSKVKKIVKLDKVPVFGKTSHTTAIFILIKSQLSCTNEVEIEQHVSLRSLLEHDENDESKSFSIPHAILGEGKWVLSPYWKKFWKMKKNGQLILPLGDLPLDVAKKYPIDFDLDFNDPQVKKKRKIEGIAHVFQGMSPGQKDIFVLSMEEAEHLQLESEFLRPVLGNSDIDRYCLKSRNKVIIYPRLIDHLANVPHIHSYLLQHESKLTQGSDRKKLLKKGKIRWFDFNVYRNYQLFEKGGTKIVCPYRCKKLRFALDDQQHWFTTDCYGIIPKTDSKIDIHYLLGLLNSAIITQWYVECGKRKGNILELFSTPLRRIPIIVSSHSDQQYVRKRVLEIIKIKNRMHNSPPSSEEEKKELIIKLRALQSEINTKFEELY